MRGTWIFKEPHFKNGLTTFCHRQPSNSLGCATRMLRFVKSMKLQGSIHRRQAICRRKDQNAATYGHLPFHRSTNDDEVFYRYELFLTSRRINQTTQLVAPGTFAAPQSELPFMPTGLSAVARCALPSLFCAVALGNSTRRGNGHEVRRQRPALRSIRWGRGSHVSQRHKEPRPNRESGGSSHSVNA